MGACSVMVQVEDRIPQQLTEMTQIGQINGIVRIINLIALFSLGNVSFVVETGDNGLGVLFPDHSTKLPRYS